MTPSMTAAERLKVLADPTRLRVIEYLMKRPRNVGDLAVLLEIEQSLLSHHLKVLREAELVVAVRDGKGVKYQLAPEVESLRTRKAIDLGAYQVLFEDIERERNSKNFQPKLDRTT